jgi:hypothetical protein
VIVENLAQARVFRERPRFSQVAGCNNTVGCRPQSVDRGKHPVQRLRDVRHVMQDVAAPLDVHVADLGDDHAFQHTGPTLSPR